MNTNCVLSFKIITLFYFESQQSQTLNRFKIIHEFCGEKRSDFYVKGYVKSTILPGVQKPIKFQCVRSKNECPCSLLSFIVLCVVQLFHTGSKMSEIVFNRRKWRYRARLSSPIVTFNLTLTPSPLLPRSLEPIGKTLCHFYSNNPARNDPPPSSPLSP